ncbi:MAG: apolipoprotein N-acyltransferase [Armatimonadota bacterium]|nr:apolipoprotein N-acyltransferase [Armatimonadota bacterium]
MRRLFLSVLGAILSAIWLWLAFPPVAWGWLAWIALVPLVLALRSLSRPSQGCFIGLVWGGCFYGVLLWWMQQFVERWTGSFWLGLAAWGALVLSQALFAGGFGWGYALVNRLVQGTALPAAWTAALWVSAEWLRGAGAWGFLWGQLAVSQHQSLLPLQSVELLGAWGLSAWMMLVNSALAEAIAQRKARPLLGAMELSLLLLLFGWWRLGLSPAADRLSALVAQPNVDTTRQWDAQMQEEVKASMLRALQKAAREKVELVLLPESLVPDATAYPFSDIIHRATSQGITVLIGTFEDEDSRSYNTVSAFSPGGAANIYRKQHLVPWGEYVPFRRWTPWVEHFGVVSADVSAGAEPALLTSWRIGAPVCFESTLPRIACGMVRQGARLLCVVTNDTWFGRSPAAEQHLAFCALRAVETRRWVLRSATTGISAVFNAQGSCLQQAELFVEAQLWAEGVELRQERTLYVRLGDAAAVVVVLVLCAGAGMLFRKGGSGRA